MGRYNNRPTQPLHSTIIGLMKRNLVTGLYDVSEDGIVYSMELEILRNLSDYFKSFISGHGQHYPTIERWYSDLQNQYKKQVKRSGRVPKVPIDFFPDTFYED